MRFGGAKVSYQDKPEVRLYVVPTEHCRPSVTLQFLAHTCGGGEGAHQHALRVSVVPRLCTALDEFAHKRADGEVMQRR